MLPRSRRGGLVLGTPSILFPWKMDSCFMLSEGRQFALKYVDIVF